MLHGGPGRGRDGRLWTVTGLPWWCRGEGSCSCTCRPTVGIGDKGSGVLVRTSGLAGIVLQGVSA